MNPTASLNSSIVLVLRLLITSGVILVSGCGVKSTPVPPQMVYPAAISDLHASAEPGGINLTWSRPTHYVSGHSLRDLGGFMLLRSEGGRPFERLVDLPVTDQERFSPQRKFSYVDHATQIGNRYRYKIVSRTIDGYTSAPSNQVEFARPQPQAGKREDLTLPARTPSGTGSP